PASATSRLVERAPSSRTRSSSAAIRRCRLAASTSSPPVAPPSPSTTAQTGHEPPHPPAHASTPPPAITTPSPGNSRPRNHSETSLGLIGKDGWLSVLIVPPPRLERRPPRVAAPALSAVPRHETVDRHPCLRSLTRRGRGQASQRPFGRIPHRRVLVPHQPCRHGGELCLAGIADRVEDIPYHPVATDPLDRRSGEYLPKPGIIERRQIRETWRPEFRPRRIADLARADGKLVPRTDRQTIVAAVDPVAHLLPQRLRHRPLMLDRQIRDASARIEPPRTVESLRRADIEAAPAGAATLLLRRVPLEFRGGEDRAEEEPVAEIPAEQVRVFPLPA